MILYPSGGIHCIGIMNKRRIIEAQQKCDQIRPFFGIERDAFSKQAITVHNLTGSVMQKHLSEVVKPPIVHVRCRIAKISQRRYLKAK